MWSEFSNYVAKFDPGGRFYSKSRCDVKIAPARSIPVRVGLEGPINFDSDVISLRLAELCKLGSQCREVQICNLLIQGLRQQIDIVFVPAVLFSVPKEIELAKHLIGERTRHNKRWVGGGASKVKQTPCRQDDHSMTVREH